MIAVQPPSAASGAPVVVETQRLTRLYEGNVRALDDVTLTIRRGEMVAVMGPSGSGKSTLLNVLGTLDRPTSGRVLVGGQDLATLANVDAFRARTVGFVFQFHNLIPTLTAIGNVMLPMRGGPILATQRRARALTLLDRVHLADHADRWPEQLSGGERQRVAVARALANQPAIVLADEPTGNLDSQSGEEVIALLRGSNVELGTTVLLVTHDPVVALETSRILTLRDGRIEQDEPVAAIYRQQMAQISQTALGRLLFGERSEGAHPGSSW